MKNHILGSSNSLYPFIIYIPSGGKLDDRWPLIVFLHGAGERGKNLELAAKWGLPRLIEAGFTPPYVVASPQCGPGAMWENDDLLELHEVLTNSYPVASSLFILTGFSMGGFAAWSFAAENPELLIAAIPIAGGGDPRSADQLRGVPIWAFHGEEDETVPCGHSTEMAAACQAAGWPVKLTFYAGEGHMIAEKPFHNSQLWKWLAIHAAERGGDWWDKPGL